MLRELSSSVTAKGYGVSSLDNAAYRKLAAQAADIPEGDLLLQKYETSINVDPREAGALIEAHPEINDEFDGQGGDRGTTVHLNGRSFLMGLERLVNRAARIGVIRGDAAAATELDEFLTLAGEGELPYYEVVVIHGLTVASEMSLGSNLDLIAYDDAAERGFVQRHKVMTPSGPSYFHTNKMSVALRKMTSNPTLVRPHSAGVHTEPALRIYNSPDLAVTLDFLSLVTKRRIEIVELIYCAPAFVDIDPDFGSGASVRFSNLELWGGVELSTEQSSEVAELLELWSSFEANKRDVLELGLARLVSSNQRHSGRFRDEDRVLDIAVALEVLYQLGGSELTYKLSIRAAHLLASPEYRCDAFNTVTQLYQNRSRIVHGSRNVSTEKRRAAAQVAERAYEIGYDTLRELLRRGKMPDWKRLVLAAETTTPETSPVR